MGRAPARVDILMGLKGLDFDTCWNQKLEASLEGIKVFFISINDLIVNKKAVGRPQDLADLHSLEQTLKKSKE